MLLIRLIYALTMNWMTVLQSQNILIESIIVEEMDRDHSRQPFTQTEEY